MTMTTYRPRGPHQGVMAPTGWKGDTAETRLLARGRAYPSRNALALAARRAERRTGWVLVDVRDAAPTPAGGDADGWDAYRLARGITGSR